MAGGRDSWSLQEGEAIRFSPVSEAFPDLDVGSSHSLSIGETGQASLVHRGEEYPIDIVEGEAQHVGTERIFEAAVTSVHPEGIDIEVSDATWTEGAE